MRLALLLVLAGLLPAQTTLDSRIRTQTKAFPANVWIYAKNLDSGAVYTLNGEERVRTASTIKLPVMIEVFAQVAEGKARFTDTITLRDADKVSGSGVVRELSDGVTLPVRDLVNLMIVVSDNTATNLILEKFGGDAVNARMESLGLQNTYVLRKIRGDANQLKAASGWTRFGSVEENRKWGIGVTSPREMVLLLEKLEKGEIVSPEASKEMIAILKRQQYTEGIGRRIAYKTASKSGSLDALRSDVGIVYTPRGRIAMAITVDGMKKTDYSMDNIGNILIADLAKVLAEML